jgi:hypothetical protein
MSALDYILMNILRTNACFDCKLTQTSKLCKGHRDNWKGQIVRGQHRRDGTGRDVMWMDSQHGQHDNGYRADHN